MRMMLQHICKDVQKSGFVSKVVDRPHLTKFHKRLEVEMINLRGGHVCRCGLVSKSSQFKAHRPTPGVLQALKTPRLSAIHANTIPGLSARCSQQ